jgi:probable rRNA maturation factor
MIEFNYETDFLLSDEGLFSEWITKIILSENKTLGDINYIFCDDEYLYNINLEHLQHDTYTDVITFDYCLGNEISGDLFISTERVLDNAKDFKVDFNNELLRVMSHGVLHLCGYKDKSTEDEILMRQKEEEKIALFHVKQ